MGDQILDYVTINDFSAIKFLGDALTQKGNWSKEHKSFLDNELNVEKESLQK